MAEEEDSNFLMRRTEVLCAACNARKHGWWSVVERTERRLAAALVEAGERALEGLAEGAGQIGAQRPAGRPRSEPVRVLRPGPGPDP